jgi:predicted transcriptional regulator
VDIIFGR